jgi:hypothetical protein
MIIIIFFRYLWLALCREFNEMRDTISFESRMELKLVDAYRNQERKRGDVLLEVRFAIKEWREDGGESKYIPKDIKSQAQVHEFLKDKYGHELKELGLILTPKLKLIRK